MPHLTLDTLESVVGSITVDAQGLRYALIVHFAFPPAQQQLDRVLVIVLGVGLDRAADPGALEGWEGEGR